MNDFNSTTNGSNWIEHYSQEYTKPSEVNTNTVRTGIPAELFKLI